MPTGSMAMAGKRVIVIDDDALVLDGMRSILQSWGCQVEIAASGDAAFALNTGPPDMIISDSRLATGKTGIEAIEHLREASAGGFHLLHKPVSPMALRTTLNRLLKAFNSAAHPSST